MLVTVKLDSAADRRNKPNCGDEKDGRAIGDCFGLHIGLCLRDLVSDIKEVWVCSWSTIGRNRTVGGSRVEGSERVVLGPIGE